MELKRLNFVETHELRGDIFTANVLQCSPQIASLARVSAFLGQHILFELLEK
jgi:hypothetical protein